MTATTSARTASSSDPRKAVTSLQRVADYTEFSGRILLAILFFIGGAGKIGGGYAATAGYMEALGVPSVLLPLVIATELLGAVALVAGWKTRITAFLLAGFTLVAAAIFHSNFADQTQVVMFLKNVSIAGGLLLLVVHGAGRISLDNRGPKSTE